MLQAVNDRWQDHLQTVEYIREGIGLRGYGQVDPLVAYKRETYDTFQTTLKQIRDVSVRMIFKAQVQVEGPREEATPAPMEMQRMEDSDSGGGTAVATAPAAIGVWPEGTDASRIGRNEPCPCGSGKKFKACHYTTFRSEGRI